MTYIIMKPIRIAINGFGRIGRVFLRQAFQREDLEVVAINDLGDCENFAYLLKYDSVYGNFKKDVKGIKGENGSYIEVAGKQIKFLQEKDPAKLPWKDMQIDVVVESTGFFEDYEKASAHIAAGAKHVVITAPGKGKEGEIGKSILMGVNEDEIGKFKVTSNVSCTTNATSPVAAIMMENPGVKKAVLNTIHAYTATQKIVDGPDAKDWRRGRAGAQNLVPSTTGAAISVAKVIKQFDGLFDGISVRVPVVSGSLIDFTFVAGRKTTVEEINDIFRKAAETPRWKDLLLASDEELVSSDILGQSHASIVDLSFTKVIDGDLVKVLAWYDNEWGYTTTLVKHVLKAGETLS
jgi:glyceraldehyde 3-phosphate dehydrogenase